MMARVLARWRRLLAGAAVVAAGLAAGAWGLDRAFPPPVARAEGHSAMVLDVRGRLLRAFAGDDGRWRFAAAPAEVDPLYLAMLTAFEDKRFRLHPGVDPLAVLRAAGQWALAGRPVSGASTLTMQTARLLEPRPRTLASKTVEALRALQLEWRYDKDAILGLYLTVAPFGGNLEGVRAASLFYFGKEPAHLTPGEAALLVALPQSPETLRPDRFPGRARAARDKVLARVEAAGVISSAAAEKARREPVPAARRPLAFLAPHLARRLVAAEPDRAVYRSLIDGDLQGRVEDLLCRRLEGLEPGATLAAIVVENGTRAVRAYVGSAAFFDAARDGQVDMVPALRSPGSTLKPLIFAAAFDRLRLHPETLIEDVPTRFGDYAPANFDRRYRGAITLREALQSSLNVPAVALLDRLGPVRFADLLDGMGARLVFDDAQAAPSLPLALGGVGTSLWDLVTLYAGLAEGGVFAPLRLVAEAPLPEGRRLLGAASAWYVARVLEGAPAPAGHVASRYLRDGRRVALKTGTSYGFRDAWAVGFDSRFTVGVWVGRPDGGYGTGRTGIRAAAPVARDIFDLLPPAGALPRRPVGVVEARHTADLPVPLRRFRPRGAPLLPAAAEAEGPVIAFPPDGATVEVDPALGLRLRASGGRKPLTWLVDGRPLESLPFQRTALLPAAGEGVVSIQVVDDAGRAARARVWVRSVP